MKEIRYAILKLAESVVLPVNAKVAKMDILNPEINALRDVLMDIEIIMKPKFVINVQTIVRHAKD